MSNAFHFQQGSVPLLVSMPHAGTELAPEVGQQMLPLAAALDDTDWHLPQLYNMLQELGASVLIANYSRYVIDLNRAPDNANLYPGQDTTGLCPVDTFHKQALYAPERLPDQAEIERRIKHYWHPYHQQLQQELARLLALHGRVVLWDAHSIASEVPRFFSGRLPDLNFGSADGSSCAAELQQSLQDCLQQHPASSAYSHVFNGRFKGGYITRQYGQPASGIHAIQLEMSQRIYMQEQPPYPYRSELAAGVQPLLGELLQRCIEFARQGVTP